MINTNLSEALAQIAEIAPQSAAAGTYLSAAFQMNRSRKVMASITVGASPGTVNAQFVQSSTSGGTYTAVTGAQMIAMTTAGTQQIEMRGDRVNATATPGPFFKLQIVVTSATSLIFGVVQGDNGRYEPCSQFNDATVLNPCVLV